MSYPRFTAQDLVYHLLSSTGGGAQDGEHSAVRMAVVHGVREVMQSKDWLWHTKQASFTTDSSATTPPTLLPYSVKTLDTLISDNTGSQIAYISPNEYLQMRANQTGVAEPFYYTILRSEAYPQQYEIKFVYDAIDNLIFHYTYRRTPEQIRYMGYEETARVGTIAGTSGATAITGTDTTFPKDAAGRVLRIGTADNHPEPVGSLVPYDSEYLIASRASGTALTLESNLEDTVSAVKYVITDEVDASPQMWTACLSACEMWYARMAGKPAGEVTALFNRDLRLALESDAISPSGTVSRVYATPRSMGWHSNLLPDVT
jgi:hypothetical protein